MPYLPIIASISDLTRNVPETFFAADAVSGASTVTVENINRIAINTILLMGEPGNEHAEFIKTHASTAPSGTTVTLASTLAFDHPDGTKIYVVDYDQVEFSHAATVAGSKTVMTTMAIDADATETIYRDTTYSSGYYFIRFKNSISSIFSGYSDPIPYGGWADNQLGSAIQYSLDRNKTGFSDKLTHDMLVQEARSGIKIFLGKLKRWSNLQDFDYQLGTTARGKYAFDVPTTMYGRSDKSVLQLRIAGRPALVWKDKREWEELLYGVKHTTVASGASSGTTTMTLTDTKDLGDSGTIMIGGVQITYTAKSTVTNIISGIPVSGTGSNSAGVSAGDDVWQGAYVENEPYWFTIFEDKVFVWPLVSSTYSTKNLLLDFWNEAPTVDSDADVLDLTRFDAIKHWLTWVVRCQVKYDGERKTDDGDLQLYTTIRDDAVNMELRTQGQKFKMKPRTNQIKFR